MGRAAALARYRVGAPLPFEELRFARRDSAGAGRVGVLGAGGSPESTAAARPPVAEVAEHTGPKVHLEVLVDDDEVDEVIVGAARTGNQVVA